ncbi:hypothetical protein J6590_011328 [Homalodisca vitripennis]|nr:hypothetical protein J6590_011328 [Homalodisca vitripennis]
MPIWLCNENVLRLREPCRMLLSDDDTCFNTNSLFEELQHYKTFPCGLAQLGYQESSDVILHLRAIHKNPQVINTKDYNSRRNGKRMPGAGAIDWSVREMLHLVTQHTLTTRGPQQPNDGRFTSSYSLRRHQSTLHGERQERRNGPAPQPVRITLLNYSPPPRPSIPSDARRATNPVVATLLFVTTLGFLEVSACQSQGHIESGLRLLTLRGDPASTKS